MYALLFDLIPDHLLIITPFSYAQLMIPGANPFTAGDLSGGTEGELADAAARYLAYSGPFKVTEELGKGPTLTHSMSVCSFPNWLGNTQQRVCHLEEDDNVLVLSTDRPRIISGESRAPVLKWRRLSSIHK
jgi:hypothetical protein